LHLIQGITDQGNIPPSKTTSRALIEPIVSGILSTSRSAECVGEQTKQYITELIEDKPYPEVAYKQALAILSLRKNYENERLENACLRGGHHNQRSYHIIEIILKKGLDKLPVEVDEKGQIHIPLHKNVRGNYK